MKSYRHLVFPQSVRRLKRPSSLDNVLPFGCLPLLYVLIATLGLLLMCTSTVLLSRERLNELARVSLVPPPSPVGKVEPSPGPLPLPPAPAALALRPVVVPTFTPAPVPTPSAWPSPTPAATKGMALRRTVYAVVRYAGAPGPGAIRSEEVAARWRQPADQAPGPLYVTEDARVALADIFRSEPHLNAPVYRVNRPQMIEALVQDPNAWGVIAVDRLLPVLYPMEVDGFDVLDPTMKLNPYKFTWHDTVENAAEWTNHDRSRFAVIILTGASRLTGPWALTLASPRAARDTLRAVRSQWQWDNVPSLFHTQLEVPVTAGCDPTPTAAACTGKEQATNLKYAGVDLVSLSGPGMGRYGSGGALYTRNVLRQQGVVTLGVVDSLADPGMVYVWSVRGYRIAMLNLALGSEEEGAWAGPDTPGTVAYRRGASEALVTSLARQFDAVVVLVRWQEAAQVKPTPEQNVAFWELIKAGASAVVGVQPGTSQRLLFPSDRVLAFGLGSFWQGTSQHALALELVFYDGHLIGARPHVLQWAETHWQLASPEVRRVIVQRLLKP